MKTTKLDLVLKVLNNSTEISDWYRDEFNITADILDTENVKTYGTGNYGDAADMIIADGVSNGVITRDQADDWAY